MFMNNEGDILIDFIEGIKGKYDNFGYVNKWMQY